MAPDLEALAEAMRAAEEHAAEIDWRPSREEMAAEVLDRLKGAGWWLRSDAPDGVQP